MTGYASSPEGERTASEALEEPLRQLHLDCDDVLGALIATEEGLLLASTGNPSGETAAAMASHLADSLDANLRLLAQARCSEALLWTEWGLWGIARLQTRHVVMVHALGQCRVANLRLALGRLRRDLAVPLMNLDTPEQQSDVQVGDEPTTAAGAGGGFHPVTK